METVADVLAHCQWLVEHGRGGEPGSLFMPRVENQRRKANKEKRTRVQFDCDPQTYADFHEQRSRYVEACGGHVPIAYAVMIRCLAQLSDEVIKRLAEPDEQEKFSEGLESA